MSQSSTFEVPVLIVGAGPVGLSMALLLAHHGVPCRVVERRSDGRHRPAAGLVNARSMEILRQCGAERHLRGSSLPPEFGRYMLRVETIAGREIARRPAPFGAGAPQPFSSVAACVSPGGAIQPSLRAAVGERQEIDLHFRCELVGFVQDDDGVTATLRERDSGEETRVRASHLVAADGARSRVREALGIRMVGHANLAHRVFITFRADLRPWFADRPPYLCIVQHPEARGGLFTIDGTINWRFSAHYEPARGERSDDFTAERCVALIRTAVGVPDLPVEIVARDPWSISAHVAERYRDGRVFLVGDAVHEMPPLGGLGMNTGIHDAHNLAWKLAGVLQGWAGPGLLDTYEPERLPIGRATTERALGNVVSAAGVRVPGDERTPAMPAAGAGSPPPHHNEWGLIFGASYASAAVVPDGTPPAAVADPACDYLPSARPGARAPHVWLRRGATTISSLDLFGSRFVVLAGPDDRAWCGAAAALADRCPLSAYRIGPGGDLSDPAGDWQATYGVEADGTVLVRPDGHVAWRARSARSAPEADLRRVLASILAAP